LSSLITICPDSIFLKTFLDEYILFLAINTSTFQFGLALLEKDGTVLAEMLRVPQARRFGGFMPSLRTLINDSGHSLRDLKAVIVATGPGSFTGLRVGLSTAKGLCQGLGVPIIGISSLEAIASQIPFTTFPIISIIDSRKGEIFLAQFSRKQGNGLLRLTEDKCIRLDELPSQFAEPSILIGNDFEGQAHALEEFFEKEVRLAPANLWNLKASAVGFLGINRFNDGDVDDPFDLKPQYHRPPDIRPNPYPLLQKRN
jgi:tRNA threonylcarbamoyl adenosine modification protein YeaZ